MFDILESFTQFCGGEAQVATSAPENPPESTAAAGADPKKEEVVADSTGLKTKSSFGPFVDPMDAGNYLVAHLTRPMGILFEENLDDVHVFGGAFIAEVKDGSIAAADGSIHRGDQLVAIGTKRISGMDFDEVMKIIEGSATKIKLTVFRGPAESLYSPWASVDWIDTFVAERGEVAALYEGQVDSFAFPDYTAYLPVKDDSRAVSPVDGVAFGAVKADLFGAATTAVLDAVDEENKADVTLGLGDAEALKPTAVEEVEVPDAGDEGEAYERNDVNADAVIGVDTNEDGVEEEADAVEEVLASDAGVESVEKDGLEEEADAVEEVLAIDAGVESVEEDGVEEEADAVEEVLASDAGVESVEKDGLKEEADVVEEVLASDAGVESTAEDGVEEEADAVEEVLASDAGVESTAEDGVEEEADAVEEVLASDAGVESTAEDGVEEEADVVEEVLTIDAGVESTVEDGLEEEADAVEEVLAIDAGVESVEEDGVEEEADVVEEVLAIDAGIDAGVESTAEDGVEEEADAVEEVLAIDAGVKCTVEDGLEEEAAAVEEVLASDAGVESTVEDGLEEEADAVEEELLTDEGVESTVEDDVNADGEFPSEATPPSNGILETPTVQMGLEKFETSPAPAPVDITESFDEKKDADSTDLVVVEDEANIIEDCVGEGTPEAETPLPHESVDLFDYHDTNVNPMPLGSVTNASKIGDLLDYPALVSDDEQDDLDLMSFN